MRMAAGLVNANKGGGVGLLARAGPAGMVCLIQKAVLTLLLGLGQGQQRCAQDRIGTKTDAHRFQLDTEANVPCQKD